VENKIQLCIGGAIITPLLARPWNIWIDFASRCTKSGTANRSRPDQEISALLLCTVNSMHGKIIKILSIKGFGLDSLSLSRSDIGRKTNRFRQWKFFKGFTRHNDNVGCSVFYGTLDGTNDCLSLGNSSWFALTIRCELKGGGFLFILRSTYKQ